MGEGTSQLTQKCSQVQVSLWMPRKCEQDDTVIDTPITGPRSFVEIHKHSQT